MGITEFKSSLRTLLVTGPCLCQSRGGDSNFYMPVMSIYVSDCLPVYSCQGILLSQRRRNLLDALAYVWNVLFYLTRRHTWEVRLPACGIEPLRLDIAPSNLSERFLICTLPRGILVKWPVPTVKTAGSGKGAIPLPQIFSYLFQEKLSNFGYTCNRHCADFMRL